MKARKKPVEIDVCPTIRVMNNEDGLPKWITDAISAGVIFAIDQSGCSIRTPEGVHHAIPESVIAKGVKGELYPIRADIFAETYEVL